SAGVTIQFGEGTLPSVELANDGSSSYLYREHFLDLTAGYGSLSLWSNFEFSSPPQIGPNHGGLRKATLSWAGGWASVRVGDLFGQFGRGLALNLWENQSIDWDSSVRGIWLRLSPFRKTSFDLVRGKVRGGRHLLPGPGVDPRVRDFSDDGTVTAIEFTQTHLFGGLSAGAYLVYVDGQNPWFSKTLNVAKGEYEARDSTVVQAESRMPGVFVEYLGKTWDAYVEFTVRDHHLMDVDSLPSTLQQWLYYDENSGGRGGYASFSVYPGRWGLTVEYKNYMLDLSDPVKRQNLPFRLGRSSPIQSPPTAFREHSSTLLSRTPHVMDFEDEVGIQVEINLELTPDLFLLFNYSQSSRHSGFRKRIRPDFSTRWERIDTPSSLWMSGGEKFRPFQEMYGELNYHYDPLGLDFKGMVSDASEVFSYSESFSEKAGVTEWLSGHSKKGIFWERRDLLTVPLEATLGLSSGWGVTVYWEHQWENLDLRNFIAFQDRETGITDSVTTDRTLSAPYYYRYVALSAGKPSQFSVGFVYDYSSDLKTGRDRNVNPDDDSWLETIMRGLGVDLRNKWFGLQFTGYLTSSTTVSFFYGSLQGGLKCDSGVCVYVPGIEDALTIVLTSNF
ncbi:MAG: DUF6029 family protein, partial [Fidelibacterota bacterium]